MLLLQLHSKQTIIIVCASESRSRRRQCFPILKWMKKKKPNPLQQLLTLEWQLNVLKPFFSLRFCVIFCVFSLFNLVWFSFCCLLSSSSVFLNFFLQAFTLSCSLFVLLFLMHVRPSQKGEQKKNQIQFEAHIFSMRTTKRWQCLENYFLFSSVINQIFVFWHVACVCEGECECKWVWLSTSVFVSVSVLLVNFIKLKTNYLFNHFVKVSRELSHLFFDLFPSIFETKYNSFVVYYSHNFDN